MMRKIAWLLVALLLVATAVAQETTAGMQGTVKDPTGAVVAKAMVEVSGAALIGVKKVETDASGYYRFANLPPGEYTLTASGQGFKTVKRQGIKLDVGKLPTIDLALEVGASETVVEVSSAAPIVDVAQSKVQTNVTEDVIAGIPKGRSFQSVINMAPGARFEPLQSTGGYSGYQIDGASNSENSYLIEGQETADIRSGQSKTNAPFEFVQEVQVKTSGFEAEFGGALGGVVNVIQKHGGNAWHGSVFTRYAGDLFNAAPNQVMRRVPNTSTNTTYNAQGVKTGTALRLDQPVEFFQPKKDHYRIVEPGYEVGGYLKKDRLWLFSSLVPQLERDRRTVFYNYQPTGNPAFAPWVGPKTFNTNVETYYALNRVDALLTQKIRLYGAFQLQYGRGQGTNGNVNTAIPGADSAYFNPKTAPWFGGTGADANTGITPPSALTGVPDGLPRYQGNPDISQDPNNFNQQLGYVSPSKIFNFGADVTLTPSLIATSRFGYFLSDFQDRGKPTSGIRYRYLDTNYNYATGIPFGTGNYGLLGTDPNCTITSADPAVAKRAASGYCDPSTPFSKFYGGSSYQTSSNNLTQFQDKYTRKSFSQDLAYFKKGFFGTHNLKTGFAFNSLKEDPKIVLTDSLVQIAFNTIYFPESSTGETNCGDTETDDDGNLVTPLAQQPNTILGQNMVLYGLTEAQSLKAGCQGKWGTFNVRQAVESTIPASSKNYSLYFQDAWTLGRGVTVNVGVRMDKESLPAFNTGNGNGFTGIDFGFGKKIAPRLGASWDILGNGKFKVYGSFGYFFDIMKYSLPRGSFGGEYWHDCAYTLESPDWTTIVPKRDANGFFCPPSATGNTGANFANALPANTRLIENFDFRAPSNDPAHRLVDPNLKPMKQHEYVVGGDWAITPQVGLEVRYSRKRLDRTIEDAGLLSANGEEFYIINPGEGIHKQPLSSTDCLNCPNQPKAARNYDAVEVRLEKRASEKWFGSLSYTYSRLRGNYSGLTSTDVSDGGGGRSDPNVSRSFDEPMMQFDAHGKLIDGPLATDRPHTIKAFGSYRLKWFHQETILGLTQQLYSGTPLSSYMSVYGAPVFLEGRGKWIDMTRDPVTGAFALGKVSEKRTQKFSQTDLNLVHELKVSKTYEQLRVGFEANVLNLFNQKNILGVASNMIRTGQVKPATAGNPSYFGTDYTTVLHTYDVVPSANARNIIMSNAYGQPNIWQDGRTMRFKVRFTF